MRHVAPPLGDASRQIRMMAPPDTKVHNYLCSERRETCWGILCLAAWCGNRCWCGPAGAAAAAEAESYFPAGPSGAPVCPA